MTGKFHFFPPHFGKIAAAMTLSGAVIALALAQWCVEPVYEASVTLAVLRGARAASDLAGEVPSETPDAGTGLVRHLDRGSFLFPGIAEAFTDPRFTARAFAPGPAAEGALRIRSGRQDDTVVITGRGNSPHAASALAWKGAHTLREFVLAPQSRPMFGTPAPPGPARRIAPDRLLWTVMGALAGVLAAYLTGRALRHFDTRRLTGREMEKFLQVPLLGILPSPLSGALLNRFRFLLPYRDGARVLLFTGVSRNAGKSQAVAHLAKLLAADGKRVLVADMDWRHPRQRQLCGVRTEPPLPDWGSSVLAEYIVPSGDSARPDLLPCRPAREEPPEEAAARTRQLEELLQTVARRYDWVLIDGPAAPGSASPVLFGRLADAVILVADGRRRELKQFRHVLYRLYSAALIPAGLVLTRSRRTAAEDLEQECRCGYAALQSEAADLARKWRGSRPED